jgi:hypothetical protein
VTSGPVVEWELERLEKRGELESGETVAEAVEAWTLMSPRRGRIGALVLTDRRLLFVTTKGAIFKRTRLLSYPLETIESVEVVASPRWGEDRGALAVTVSGAENEPQRVEFERILGGRDRASELAAAIGRSTQPGAAPSR